MKVLASVFIVVAIFSLSIKNASAISDQSGIPVTFKITAITESIVKLSGGTNQGILVGDYFLILVHGKRVGEVIVNRVEANQSTAIVVNAWKWYEERMEVGAVALKVPSPEPVSGEILMAIKSHELCVDQEDAMSVSDAIPAEILLELKQNSGGREIPVHIVGPCSQYDGAKPFILNAVALPDNWGKMDSEGKPAVLNTFGKPEIIIATSLIKTLENYSEWWASEFAKSKEKFNTPDDFVKMVLLADRQIDLNVVPELKTSLDKETEPDFIHPSVDPANRARYEIIKNGLFKGAIAFILGHEMGHWIHGDPEKNVELWKQALASGNANNYQFFVTLPERREQESKADQAGIVFALNLPHANAKSLGSDPEDYWVPVGMDAAASLLMTMQEISQKKNIELLVFQDHPYSNDRWSTVCVDSLEHLGLAEQANSACANIEESSQSIFESAYKNNGSSEAVIVQPNTALR